MKSSSTAIETQYKGYRFRSRTEARWAVYFDAMAIEWQYEREGFELPGGRYLPDFFTLVHGDRDWYMHMVAPGRRSGFWVEIKGQAPTDLELQLLGELAVATGHHAFLFAGAPGDESCWSARLGTGAVTAHTGYCQQAFWQKPVSLGIDPATFAVVCLHERALAAARGARFEHGESGARC